MNLTENDKKILKDFGYVEEDFEQIEEATKKTTYKLNYKERISCAKAIELLGRKTFLGGISRSAFHRSASRNVENSNDIVAFDSSKLFK